MEVKLNFQDDDDVKKIIQSLIEKEFKSFIDKRVEQYIKCKIRDLDKVVLNAVKHILNDQYSGTPWLKNMKLNSLTEKVLKSMLKPYLKNVIVEFSINPNISNKEE